MSIELQNDSASVLSAQPIQTDRVTASNEILTVPTVPCCGPSCCQSRGAAAANADEPAPARTRDEEHHLDRLRAMPDVRQAKIASIKEQLKAGTYDADQLLNRAIERMLDEMD